MIKSRLLTHTETVACRNMTCVNKASLPRLIGSVYTGQIGGIGYESYHFASANNCYRNFTAIDLKLDDGSKFPTLKHFSDIYINETERIFKGKISWFPSSYKGEASWMYEIHFTKSLDKSIPSLSRFVSYDTSGKVVRNVTLGVIYRYTGEYNTPLF